MSSSALASTTHALIAVNASGQPSWVLKHIEPTLTILVALLVWLVMVLVLVVVVIIIIIITPAIQTQIFQHMRRISEFRLAS